MDIVHFEYIILIKHIDIFIAKYLHYFYIIFILIKKIEDYFIYWKDNLAQN